MLQGQIYNEVVRVGNNLSPAVSITPFAYTITSWVAATLIQSAGDFCDAAGNILVFSYGTETFKLTISTGAVASVSAVAYNAHPRALLRDRAGDDKLWIVNINAAAYGLYKYDGTTLTKMHNDAGIGRLAYDTNGYLYYRDSAANYYKCYNGGVSVDTPAPIPDSLSLAVGGGFLGVGYPEMQPNGAIRPAAATGFGSLINETGTTVGYMSQGIHMPITPATATLRYPAGKNIHGADDYIVIHGRSTDTTNYRDLYRTIIMNKNTLQMRLLDDVQIPIQGSSVPVPVAFEACNCIGARYVAGEGLYVYTSHCYSVEVAVNRSTIIEILYPIKLNF